MDRNFVIYNFKNGLFWNDQDGWGHFDTATRYTFRQRHECIPPIDGHWFHLQEVTLAMMKDPDE